MIYIKKVTPKIWGVIKSIANWFDWTITTTWEEATYTWANSK